MKNQITSRDYKQLSAFLDDQLTGRERERLEARLKTDLALQSELKQLEQTRLLLRSVPRIRAPRNYYLSPQTVSRTVEARPAIRWAPAMGIVSAVATILLVVVIFGDTLLSSTTPVAVAPAAQAVIVPAESADSAPEQMEREQSLPTTALPTEALPLIMMEVPPIASPIPPEENVVIGEALNPTPTTIFLYAYPPTSTQEIPVSILEGQTSVAKITCEEYLASGAYPTFPYLLDCPTPTPTLLMSLQSIMQSSTPTTTITTTLSLELIPSPSFTPTQTPSPVYTPFLTDTPYSTLLPTDTPAPFINATPVIEQSAPSAKALPGEPENLEGPGPTEDVSIEESSSTPDVTFIRYFILGAEISLAAIAITAGIAAIILRIRAG
jgi:hypothetical protein